MVAEVLHLRDFDRAPVLREPPEEPAVVIILPVIRVERAIAEIMAKPPARARRSLLADQPA